jgi:hypothetical protein
VNINADKKDMAHKIILNKIHSNSNGIWIGITPSFSCCSEEYVPHRQAVFTIPKMLRIFFRYKRPLMRELCQAAVQSLLKYFQVTTGTELCPGVVVASIQTFGRKINLHPYIHYLVTEGGEDGEGSDDSLFRPLCQCSSGQNTQVRGG